MRRDERMSEMELGTESRCVAEGRLCDPLNWMAKVVGSQP
jgi:hypothetical protein